MTVFKEVKTHINIFTDDKKIIIKIDEILKAKRPGAEMEPRVQSGRDDGYDRYYKASNQTVNGIKGKYFKIQNGFKQRLLDSIIFDKVEVLPPLLLGNQIGFLRESMPSLPFKPYKHQLQAFMALTKDRNALPIVATGGGKSLIAYMVLKYYVQNNMKCALVVPTIGLTSQMYEDFKSYNAPQEFLDNIRLIGGENNIKDFSRNITISTWQSLQNVVDKMNVFDVIMVDEAHTAKADVLQSILNQPADIKIGMTGSMPIIKTDAMKLEQALGLPNRIINAKQLMDLNLLTDTTIIKMYLNYHRRLTKSGMKYQEEVKFVRESIERQEFVQEFLEKLKGVTVALYNTTQHGEDTFESLTGVKLTGKLKSDFEMMKEHNVFFMSGGTKSSVREQIRLYLNDCEQAIVIGQFSVLSTGINIPRLKNLVFLSSTKSYTLILQAIGRIMRLHHEKGDNVYVWDLIDVFDYKKDTYSLKHSYQRDLYYRSEGHPCVEKEIYLS